MAVHTRPLPCDMYEPDLRARRCAAPCRGLPKDHVRRLEGNAVVEYLPNISGHKGEATRWITRQTSSDSLRGRAWVAYIGDDITDEDAFRAIDCGIGVLVGLRPTAATHKLDGIAEVDRFLRWLAAEGNVRTAMMNAAQLGSTLSDSLRGTRLIVVANREPYIHVRRTRQRARTVELDARPQGDRWASNGCGRRAAWSPRSIR